MEVRERLIFDKGGDFAIRFAWKEDSPIWVNFKAVEAVSSYEDMDNPTFHNYDLGGGYESVIHELEKDFDTSFEENPLMHGFIKWDGCMEIHDLTHHFCGYSDILDRITKEIYKNGKEIMKDKYDDL